MKTIKYGSQGEEVKILQQMLNIDSDGVFGEYTKDSVIEFQINCGLKPDGVVGQKTWKFLLPYGRFVNEIIIHCSATPENKHVTVEDIRKYHLIRGFKDIGYHYIIYLDGSIHEGRHEYEPGAHCTGHNKYSIGICYVGGIEKDGKTPKDTRTQAQKESLIKLINELKLKYPLATIHGHNEFANKACPCFNVKKEF